MFVYCCSLTSVKIEIIMNYLNKKGIFSLIGLFIDFFISYYSKNLWHAVFNDETFPADFYYSQQTVYFTAL